MPVDSEVELVDSEVVPVDEVLCEVLALVEVDVESAVAGDVLVFCDPPLPNPGEFICVDREASPVDSDVTAVFNVVTLPFVVLKPVDRDATPVKS
ncbi:hypothetical protein [Burkholderia sola]|uniref:hypothetical protein n=1 Tax=Burkholderia sola TaxID=2843302 RepID=UPI0023DDB791|nr:hypothetical protein [Burkholderia sola]